MRDIQLTATNQQLRSHLGRLDVLLTRLMTRSSSANALADMDVVKHLLTGPSEKPLATSPDDERNREIFFSVETLAEFVRAAGLPRAVLENLAAAGTKLDDGLKAELDRLFGPA